MAETWLGKAEPTPQPKGAGAWLRLIGGITFRVWMYYKNKKKNKKKEPPNAHIANG